MVIDSTSPAPAVAPCVHGDLLDFLSDALLVTDPEGRIHTANAALSALVGYARGYALGKPIHALFQPESLAMVRERMAQAAKSGRTQEFEALWRPHRRGLPRDVRVRLGSVRDADGALVGLRWLVRDVTEETRTVARLHQAEAAHARDLRTRTMELEATVRMLQAQLTSRYDDASTREATLAPRRNGGARTHATGVA